MERGAPKNNDIRIENIKSIKDILDLVNNHNKDENSVYLYRGQKANAKLLPKAFETNAEYDLYMEFTRLFPEEFHNNMPTIQKLVKMQHYGLPTRLLDVTFNPLVALFFACYISTDESNCIKTQKYENVHFYVFKVHKGDILSYNSDKGCILANLARMEEEKKEKLVDFAKKCRCVKYFNNNAGYLLHNIRQERPFFLPEIQPNDITRNFFLLPTYNNQRIRNQDGAFIIFGGCSTRCKVYDNDVEDFVIHGDYRESILKELEKIGIDEKKLFPEMENVALCIKNKFSNKSK